MIVFLTLITLLGGGLLRLRDLVQAEGLFPSRQPDLSRLRLAWSGTVAPLVPVDIRCPFHSRMRPHSAQAAAAGCGH